MSNAGSNAAPTDAAHAGVRSHRRRGVASPALAAVRTLSAAGHDAQRTRCSWALIWPCRRWSLRLSRWSAAGCGAGLTEGLGKSGC